MGLMYEYFAAENDGAATLILTEAWPPPTFCDEGIPPEVLAELEALLTDRSSQDIAVDPRHGTQIATKVDEGAGVAECGVVTVTDTLTRALAAADDATLSTVAATWQHPEATLPGLAAVARHAAAHGHRMYCFWII